MNEYRLKNYTGSFYICGFIGAGKSTIGKALAKELTLPFQDLDKYVERKEGCKISEIFKNKGEEYFRIKEWEYLLELTRNFVGVVSLGGGALQNQQVVDHLKLHGLLILVDIPLDVIVSRIRKNTKRPIVIDEDGELKTEQKLLSELKVLYSKRSEFYQQAQIKLISNGTEGAKKLIPLLIDKIKKHV